MANSNIIIQEGRKEGDICMTSSRKQYEEKRKVESEGIILKKKQLIGLFVVRLRSFFN